MHDVTETGFMRTPNAQPLEIRDESIRLGQLLKLASLAEDGLAAKELIEHGLVKVNGDIETRRGRQLRNGDVVEVNGEAIQVVSAL